jgi:succinoglycan biosynthesis transport protein ExoP
MNAGRAETLQAALRRSLPLIGAFVLAGIIVTNLFMQVRGARYEAKSRALLTTTDITTIVTNTESIFVDPERVEDQAVALAKSPELYLRTAKANPGLGDARTLQAKTEVDAAKDIINFLVTTDSRVRSRAIANALLDEYVRWRRQLTGAEIDRAIAAHRLQLRRESGSSQRANDLRDRLNSLEILKSLNTGNVVPIQRASEAKKVSPALIRDSAIGAILGLLLALLFVLGREAIDTKVRSEEDVEEILEVPVLASVQSLPRRTRLVMLGRHEEQYGDAYALLAASVMQGRGEPARTLAVTSAVPQEGKTTTAANLAIALALRGSRVVLVDFDVRRPSVDEVFRLPHDALGVADYAAGRAGYDETLWSVSLNGRTPIGAVQPALQVGENGSGGRGGSLRVMPAGAGRRLHGVALVPHLNQILEELQDDADVIVCDTPPALLTVEMAELAQVVDRVLVVVRQGRVTRRALRSLGRQAQGWRAGLVGAVLTDATLDEQRNYYYRKA